MSDPHDHDSKPQDGLNEEVQDDLGLGLDGPDGDGVEQGLVTGRTASVRFNRNKQSAHTNNRARMDAANQSLADALKITYGLLQVGMVVLVLLFASSGLQRVNEGQRGIKVFLGNPTQTNLEPGLRPSWPYPIGEMITVGVGSVEVPLGHDFMSAHPGGVTGERLLNEPLGNFNDGGRLNPASDSMILTADQNIAHAQLRVIYQRTNHRDFVENVLPRNEEAIVRLAVRQGVVHTMAETTIDDLLKSSAEAIGARIRSTAQSTLDELGAGITIDRVVLVRKTPPLYLLDKFASVQSSAQNAGKLREDALLQREQILNEVAGRASSVLIEMINEYERLIELRQVEESEALLAQIDAVMAGEEAMWNGESTLGLISGEVSAILNEAEAVASSRVSAAIASLEQFRAKQAQFEANPRLMIARDWSAAMNEFLNRDFVTTMYLPEGRAAEILLNPDQDWEEARVREQNRKEAARQLELRRQEMVEDFYRTQRGIQTQDEQ